VLRNYDSVRVTTCLVVRPAVTAAFILEVFILEVFSFSDVRFWVRFPRHRTFLSAQRFVRVFFRCLMENSGFSYASRDATWIQTSCYAERLLLETKMRH
jgi:hypothetical protein